MSCPRWGQCQPHEPPPQAVPPAGLGWPKRCPLPKQISPCRRGIGSPGPFQLFVLVLSLGKETLMGPMTVPGGGTPGVASWRAKWSSREPQMCRCAPAFGRLRCLLGRETIPVQVGLGSSRLYFGVVFFWKCHFSCYSLSPAPLTLPSSSRGGRRAAADGRTDRRCLSWSGAPLLCIRLKSRRHLCTEPDCVLGAGVSSEEPCNVFRKKKLKS